MSLRRTAQAGVTEDAILDVRSVHGIHLLAQLKSAGIVVREHPQRATV